MTRPELQCMFCPAVPQLEWHERLEASPDRVVQQGCEADIHSRSDASPRSLSALPRQTRAWGRTRRWRAKLGFARLGEASRRGREGVEEEEGVPSVCRMKPVALEVVDYRRQSKEKLQGQLSLASGCCHSSRTKGPSPSRVESRPAAEAASCGLACRDRAKCGLASARPRPRPRAEPSRILKARVLLMFHSFLAPAPPSRITRPRSEIKDLYLLVMVNQWPRSVRSIKWSSNNERTPGHAATAAPRRRPRTAEAALPREHSFIDWSTALWPLARQGRGRGEGDECLGIKQGSDRDAAIDRGMIDLIRCMR